MEASRKKGFVAAIVLGALFLLAAAGSICFYFGAMQADEAIAGIDAVVYKDVTAKKGAQYNMKGEPLTAEIKETLTATEYHTPLGFTIVSHSGKWTGDKLVDIYNELLKNGHGDEIGYLSQVVLWPGEAESSDEFDSLGERTAVSVDGYIYVDVRALIPPKLRYDTDPVVSDIPLYYMDSYDNASQVATTLAHEYGHHYTIYYFMQDDSAVLNSEYYILRGVKDFGHAVFFSTAESYHQNYMWDIYEIGANDYVQLMGSPDAKQTGEYMDGRDLLDADVETYNPSVNNTYINVFPQKNIFIPLADEIPGLRDYFYSFIGLENEYDTPLQTVDFNLEIKKQSKYGKRWYEITWTMAEAYPDALYTLVCYDENGELYWPVRTVYGSETPVARVGKPVKKRGNWIYWWDDNITDEDRIFKLYMLLPDGRMQASEPFYVDF